MGSIFSSWPCIPVHVHTFSYSVATSYALPTGEATHLSSDFRRICETYFPHGELAQIIARQHVGTPQAQHRVSMHGEGCTVSSSLVHHCLSGVLMDTRAEALTP